MNQREGVVRPRSSRGWTRGLIAYFLVVLPRGKRDVEFHALEERRPISFVSNHWRKGPTARSPRYAGFVLGPSALMATSGKEDIHPRLAPSI